MRTPQPMLRLIALVGALAIARPTFAHHSRDAFDMTKNVTYRGIVKEYRWQNPHSHIVIVVGSDAKNSSTVGTWDIEASSVKLMTDMGWSKATFKLGELITVVAHPSKDGSHKILLFYVVKSNGTRLYRATHRYPSEEE